MCNENDFEKKYAGVIEMTLEEKLMGMDFSRFSKVQASLLDKINMRRQIEIEEELMNEEELDLVAAAGTRPISDKQTYPPKKI